MAKILSFQNKGDATANQEFLTDGNQTLSFRPTKDGGISLGNLRQPENADLFPDPRKDWSNQELADLFRVRQLLSGANVIIDTDRGVTDEGDPWFVFCDGNGEVFIHLCRIGDTYFLDSPNVRRPLRGGSFDALIADFTNQALPARGTEDGKELRVIRLERGGKVRLHPSAMLAALIWTLFLSSEELVMLAPGQSSTEGDALLDFDALTNVDEAATATAADLFLTDSPKETAQILKQEAPETEYTLTADGQMRETMLQQQGIALQNNAFSMGLSTIAIAMGFMSETVLLDNQRKVLASLEELGLAKYRTEGQDGTEGELIALDENNDILAMLADFLGVDLSLNTEVAVQGSGEREQMLDELSVADASAEAVVAIDTAVLDIIQHDENLAEQEAQTATSDATAVEESEARAVEEYTLAAAEAQNSSSGSLSDIIQTWELMMEEFQLGDTTIKTSFDISQTDSFALFDLIDSASDQRTTNFQEFDNMAERLIAFLEAKDGEFGIIELENEIIMIDLTAVTGGQTEFMNWETSDGKIISLVGLASDFAQFDMIA